MLPADAALAECVAIFPGFAAFWDSDDNLFRDDDGTFTLCGVYAQFSWYLAERWQSVTKPDLRSLAALAERHFDRDDETRGVLGACLIENLDREPFAAAVAAAVRPDILDQFRFGG